MRLRLLSLVLAFAVLALPAVAQKKQQWVPGQVLVKYKSGFAPDAGKHGVKKSKAAFGRFKLKGKAKQAASERGLDRVYLLEVDDVRTAVDQLSKDPSVEYAEPNWILEGAAVPNDPSYATQWGLAKIGAPQAWDVATSGSGVVVGVVDTGVDLTHPDLAANLWTNPGEIASNNVDDDGNGFVDDVHGWDFGSDDNDPTDEHGHGTMVAGVIGAVGNNAAGISGVAWTAKVAALRVGNMSSSASVYAAVQAVAYANAMGFRITNHSYGWWEGGQSWLFDDVVAAAEAQGNLFIVAAGNESHDNDHLPHYPSHYTNSNVLSVTSTTAADELSSFANWGAVSVDLAAPGTNIETTARGGGYANVSGTSVASPLVAGAAALYWTANPALTHVQVRDALLLHTDPLPALNQTTVSGGRLSLANLFDGETAAPGAISDLTVLDATFRSVTLRLTATGDDGATGRAARYDVRVSSAPLTESNWASATQLAGEPIPAASGTLETFRLTGLASATAYHVGVRAIDNAGNAGALSNVVSFTTTRAAVLFDDNVEGGARDWTADGLWHVEGGTWRYATQNDNYDTGAANRGALTSRELDLTNAVDARLQFRHNLLTERQWGRDLARLQLSVDGGAWQTVLTKMSTDYIYRTESIDLASLAGHRVRIRFDFDTIDAQVNQYYGWSVDDVRVEATSSNAPPVAVIAAPPPVTEDVAASLSSAGSSDPEGAALEYKWSFGDGTFAYTSGTTVSHTWTRPIQYTVTLTAFDGQNASDPVTVTISPAPVNDRPVVGSVSFWGTPPYAEETTVQVFVNDESDEEGSPLTCRYDWGDGTSSLNDCHGWAHAWNAPGTYTVSIVANDGQLDSLPATKQIVILETSNDKPIARAGGPYDAHPNETITLDGSASSDEETSIASYLWTFPDGTTSAAATPSKAFASGTYDVPLVVTDATSVASTPATAKVRVCGGAAASFFSAETFTCPGGAAKIGVNIPNGIAPLTLNWADGYTQSIPSLSNGYYAERIVTPTERTVYGLTSLTDFLGCAGTVTSSTIAVDFASAAVGNATWRICPGQSVELTPTLRGSGPFTLVWNDGFTQTAMNPRRTVSPTTTTTYSIASMTCASCPPGTNGLVSGATTVEVLDPPSATLSGGGTSCNGSSVPLTVTIAGGAPPFQVYWSDGVFTTANGRTYTRNVSPASTTTYTVTSVWFGSCSGPATGSATVTRWNGTLPSVTNVSGTTTMCPSAPPATLTATLAGEGLPFTLTWNDGFVQTVDSLTATRTVDPAVTTTYSVTSIRNAAGCNGSVNGSGNATVFRRAAVTATVSGGGTFCPGTSKNINIALTGTGPWTLTWNDGHTHTVSSSSAVRSVTPTAETTYFLTEVRDNTCAGTASGSVTFTPLVKPTAVVSGGGGYCPGSSATITATLTGTGPFQVTWTDGVTQTVSSGNVATRQVSPSSWTNYSVWTLTDAYCSGTSSGTAAVFPRSVPTATVSGGGLSCATGGARIAASLSGGVGPYTITWSDGVTQTNQGSTAERYVSPSATTTYTVTSVQDQSCSGTSSGSATVTAATGPSAVVSGGGSFCPGGSTTVLATLSGTGPFTVTWSDGWSQSIDSGNTATRIVSPSSQTTYTLSYFRDATCVGTSSGSATATPVTAPSAVVSGGGSYCPGSPVTVSAALSGTGPFTILWSDGVTQQVSGTTATRSVSPSDMTEYRITSISNDGCTGTSSGSAVVLPRTTPTAVVSGGGSYCEGASTTITATLTGTAPFNVLWSDGVTSTTSSTTITRSVGPSSTTVYTIASFTDAYCSGTASGSATATPTTKPSISQQPQNKTIPKGTATTLNVVASGTGLSYQWYQGPSGTTTTPVGTNSASFTTPKLRANTQYWVKIWKTGCASYPTNSATATVTVQ